MTDSTPDPVPGTPATASPAAHPRPARPRRGGGQAGPRPDARPPVAQPQAARPQPRSTPVLEQLAALYPHLFGAEFLPLKRGIFQDLMAAHPEALQRDSLKEALATHTRSTRYLSAVADGKQRHDLQGLAVEAMAPEHVHHALLEVFRRRQGRTGEDLRPRLRERIVLALEASGLTREAYAERVRSRDEPANAVLDEALQEAAARAAKDEALLRAFAASGQSIASFADMYGMQAHAVASAVDRARQPKPVMATPAAVTPTDA